MEQRTPMPRERAMNLMEACQKKLRSRYCCEEIDKVEVSVEGDCFCYKTQSDSQYTLVRGMILYAEWLAEENAMA